MNEYAGMSYEQASREAERLIKTRGWFANFDRIAALREIMQWHLRNAQARCNG